MKILKRILLALVIVVLAIQVPFVYRRYRLGRLAAAIAQSNANRIVRGDPKYKEYTGVIHAHTSLGGHSTGSFDEIIGAANAAGLDFVLMTEHWSESYDTSALTLNGTYGKTLFVGGNEIDTAGGDRLLMIPGGPDAAGMRKMSTGDVLEKLGTENRLALVTSPETFKSWDSSFGGVEVFSIHANAKQMNAFTTFFDMIWSYPAYPELTYAGYFRRPDANLRKYDEAAAKTNGGITLFAGTDAHSNIGFHLFGDDAGNQVVSLKLDRYETIFRLARLHVLVNASEQLTPDSLKSAIGRGRAFIGLDVLGDTTGFAFGTEQASIAAAMGDQIDRNSATTLKLKAFAPIPGRFVVLKNGEKFYETGPTTEIAFNATQPGAYRVEVYRDDLGPPFDEMPWIISNPIYVR